MTEKNEKKTDTEKPQADNSLDVPHGYGGFTRKEIAILKATSFSACRTMDELAVACTIAKRYDLDPFLKEIWAIVLRDGRIIMEASASGWRKVIRRAPKFKRMVLEAFYPSDTVNFDLINSRILEHNTSAKSAEEVPLGAYCFVEYEDGTSNLDRVFWSEYGKEGTGTTKDGKKYSTPWQYKREMIKNKASAIFGRTYCGVSALYAEGEIDQDLLPERKTVEIIKEKKEVMREAKTNINLP